MDPVVEHNTTKIPLNHQKSPSPWVIARRKFLKNKIAMIALVFLVFITVISFLAPYITTEDPAKVNIAKLMKAPSADNWLGTDNGGRDIFTRLLYGGRVSLTIGFIATLNITIIGTLIGAVAGYFGGKVDAWLMRFTDFIMVFPFLIFVIVLNAIFPKSGISALIFVISVLGWGGVARLVRSKVLSEKENDYIAAAISIGTPASKVIYKHLLPNVISTVIVQATILLASMIVFETGISFLGFGVPQTIPSWGNMISPARNPNVIQFKPWIWMPPGIVLTLTILSVNFVGEGLKDAFNPKSNR